MSALASFTAPSASLRPTELLALARSRSPDDRQRLLLGVAALCDAAPPTPGDPAHAVLGEIFLVLAGRAEREVRRALSECLASTEWAPPALINMLALDEIEIARPVIASSPLLQDADLLAILVKATLEHQIAVAGRAGLSAPLCDAVIDRGEPAAMTALACNRTARITDRGVERLVEASSRVAALRSPLVRHPKMNQRLAERLYGFVGQALRQAIGERFRLDEALLESAVDDAVRAAYLRKAEPPPVNVPPADADRDDMERRLVAKLRASGQLRAGYLIRAVREGRLSLFEHALTALGGFAPDQIRRALSSDSADALLLACASVGIDRAVFPALLEELRRLNGGLPRQAPGAGLKTSMSPDSAARAFRLLMRS